MAAPGPEAARSLLQFLPIFEDPDFGPGIPRGGIDDGSGVIEWQCVEYSSDVMAFVELLYADAWVVPFDWGSWQVDAEWLVVSGQIDTTDLDTLRRLLTLIVRKERFCDGFLFQAFERGLVVRILRRLEALTPVADAG